MALGEVYPHAGHHPSIPQNALIYPMLLGFWVPWNNNATFLDLKAPREASE